MNRRTILILTGMMGLGAMKTAFVLLFALTVAGQAQAQNSPAPLHQPRGTAVDVSNAEILAAVARATSQPFSNQTLRVLNVNGEYNLGVAVLYRAKTDTAASEAPLEHSQITEVYYMISGNGTFVTGGTLENEREVTGPAVGPSSTGGKLVGGQSRTIAPGDVVIIPPNTPHWFSEIATDQIVYLVVRVDPHKVLALTPAPAGSGQSGGR